MTLLKDANLALRQKKYEKAISLYEKIISENSEFRDVVDFNLKLAKKNKDLEEYKNPRSIDIVVPVFNALEDVKKCLFSLEKNTENFNVKIFVVNDGSEFETTEWLRNYCAGNSIFNLIEHEKNLGYTKAVNTGLRASNADYVITQNSDTIVSKGWLSGLIHCIESNPNLGIVGPLSNAASWQNVPYLYDETKAFAVNEIPNGYSVDEMAELVRSASTRMYPRLPFANGFCFMIKKAVLKKIGFMDEENFPIGYGEENDFCIRAMDAGFEIAIADDTYVFHAKSKSFGHENRKKLSQQGTENLKKKHTVEKYTKRVNDVKKTEVLDQVRLAIQRKISENSIKNKSNDLMSMHVLFLLPVKGGGGGAHSVVQEVAEMRRLGFKVNIGIKREHVNEYYKNYEIIPDHKKIFVEFNDVNELVSICKDYDVIVGTIFSSMQMVKKIIKVHNHILPAYYVQDYEPLFFEKNTEKWKEAFESYNLVNGAFLFAKTQWIIDEVANNHHVKVHKVSPSIDHSVYKPLSHERDGKLHIAVMIRPASARRGAARSMRILSRLNKEHPNKLSFHLFGCSENDPDFENLVRDFPYTCYGPLKREEVAALLGKSDIFFDFSDYQAFGRTALEAMACGCAALVPAAGGAHEYAVDGVNAIVIDTLNEDEVFNRLSELIQFNRTKIEEMKQQGLLTAARYSVHQAAVSEFVPLFNALKAHRVQNPIVTKSKLVLLPSRGKEKNPTGSGYVRVIIPYNSKEVNKQWSVETSLELPVPGSANVVLIQRDAKNLSLLELKKWFSEWKKSGGKLIYEIDDDLTNIEELKLRGFNGDLKEILEKLSFLATNADVVTVSTPYLADIMGRFNNNVKVLPNRLDIDLWNLHQPRDHSKGPFARKDGDPIRIGYIGTSSHIVDLPIVSDAMQVLQKKYGSKIEIEVIGVFQDTTPTFGKRVGLPKKNDYPDFVNWLQQRVHWDIGIIPLIDDEFNKSKSYLKFLEYAALDMAIVVSDVSAYQDVIENDVNCIAVSNSVEAWVKAVSRLIENSELRRSISLNARNKIINQYLISDIQSKTLSAFR